MPAYRKKFDPLCACGKRALYEVFNSRNASMGWYCLACADALIARMNAWPLPG